MASVADWFKGHGLSKFAEKLSPTCSVSLEEFLRYDDKQLKAFAKSSLGLDILESKRMVKEVRKLIVGSSGEGMADAAAPSAAAAAAAAPAGGMTASGGEALMAPKERNPVVEKVLFDEWKKVSELETELTTCLASLDEFMAAEQKRLTDELQKWSDLCATKEALLAAWAIKTAEIKERSMREQFTKLRSWQTEVEAKSKGGSGDTIKLTKAMSNVRLLDSSATMVITLSSLCKQTELVYPLMDECDIPSPPNSIDNEAVAVKDGTCIVPLIFEFDLNSDEPDLSPDIKSQCKPDTIEAMMEDKKGNLVSLVKLSLKKFLSQSKSSRKEWMKWKGKKHSKSTKEEDKSSKKKKKKKSSSKKRRKKRGSDSDDSDSDDDSSSSDDSSSDSSSSSSSDDSDSDSDSSSSSGDSKKKAKRKKKEKKRAKEIERFRNMPDIVETIQMFQEEMAYGMEEEAEDLFGGAAGGGGGFGMGMSMQAQFREELKALLIQYGMSADTLEAALDEFLPLSKTEKKKKKSSKKKKKKKKTDDSGTLKSSKSGESAAAASSSSAASDKVAMRELEMDTVQSVRRSVKVMPSFVTSSVKSAFDSAASAVSGALTLGVPEGESAEGSSADDGGSLSASGMDDDAKSIGSTGSMRSKGKSGKDSGSSSMADDVADEMTGLGFAYYLTIPGLKPDTTTCIRIFCYNEFGISEMVEPLKIETDSFWQLKWDAKLAKKHNLLKTYVKFKKDNSVAQILGFEPSYGTTLRGTLAFAVGDLKHFCWEIKIREVGQGMNLGMMIGTEQDKKKSKGKKKKKKQKMSKKEQMRYQAMMSQWGSGYGSIDAPVFTAFASSMLISCEIYQSMGGMMYCYTATSDIQLTIPNGTIMNNDVIGFDVNLKKASADVYLNYTKIGTIPGLPIFGDMKVTPMIQCYNNGGGTMPIVEIKGVDSPADLKKRKKKK